MTGKQTAVCDDSGSQTGSERQKHHIFRSASGAELPFGESAGVGIVLQAGAQTGLLFDEGDGRDSVPSGQVRRREHRPGCGIQRSPAADPHTDHVLFPHVPLGQQFVEELAHPAKAAERIRELRGGKPSLSDNPDPLPLQFTQKDRALCSADIQSGGKPSFHHSRLPSAR